MNNKKIYLSIITYKTNEDVLEKLLDSIKFQVDKIFIIDNTPNFINGFEKFRDEKTNIIYLNENTGIAHAQNIGIKKSLEDGADFIYPYLFNDFTTTIEGPYLYKDIQIKKDDIVIDAGANFGLFSALASSLGAIVYAFEPVKITREKYLKETAKLNENINIISLALSNTIGNIFIKGGSSVTASIVENLNKKEGDLINEMVSTITLDDWVKQNNISKIDFIKADIEGAERLMLEGAQWVLKNYAPKLAICTYHLPDDKKVLTDLILKANPNYKIIYKWKKLYAWVENS